MTISVTTIGQTTNGGSQPTFTLTATVPAGALIIVNVTDSGGTSSVTDTAGNSYTEITPIGGTPNPINHLFYCSNCLALSGGTITYHKVSSGSFATMIAAYATGIANAVLDPAVTVSQTNNGSSTDPVYTLTSGVPSVAGELFISEFQSNFGANEWRIDTGNGWTQISFQGGSNGIAYLSYQVNAGTGTKKQQPGNPFHVGTSLSGYIIGFMPSAPPHNTKSKPFVLVFT